MICCTNKLVAAVNQTAAHLVILLEVVAEFALHVPMRTQRLDNVSAESPLCVQLDWCKPPAEKGRHEGCRYELALPYILFRRFQGELGVKQRRLHKCCGQERDYGLSAPKHSPLPVALKPGGIS